MFTRFSRFATSALYLEQYQPTGGERVDRSIDEMKNRLEAANAEEQFQATGVGCKVVLDLGPMLISTAAWAKTAAPLRASFRGIKRPGGE